ncbi:MAG: delta-60 repeat domain-containing protein, partial [Flavobacteriales bacterium]
MLGLATRASAQQPFQLDPSFRTDISHINVRGVLPLEDGRVILSGQLQFPGDPNIRSGARLFSDGSRDLTFPPVANMGGRMQRWGDKYYCGNGDIVRRHFISGGIDPSFIMLNNDPLFSSLQGADYHVYPDGSLVITGVHNLNDPAHGFVGYYSLIWFDATGHVDTTKHHRWSNGSSGVIAQLTDGKFMLNCICTQYEGRPTSRAMRIHPDGALDTTFFAGINGGAVHAFHGLPDGRVYVGGHFTIAGQPGGWRHLVRLLPDGSLDPTFNNNLQFGLGALTGIGAAVVSITPIGNDRLLLCGGFQSVSGQPRYGICMIDTTGQLTDDFSDAGCGTYTYQGFTYGSPDAIAFDGQGFAYLFGAFHGYSDG